jgi:hypothetical protein
MLIVPMSWLQSVSPLLGSRSSRLRVWVLVTTNSTGAALLVSSLLQLSVANAASAAAARVNRVFMVVVIVPLPLPLLNLSRSVA